MTTDPGPTVAVAVLAAGSGSRFAGAVNKAYLPLDGLPMVAWSLRRAAELDRVVATILVIADADRERATDLLEAELLTTAVELVVGGTTRHASEWAVLRELENRIDDGAVDIVVIHDGARPYAEPALFEAVVEQAARHGGAIPGRSQDAVVPVDPDGDRAGDFVTVQTPQAFRARELLAGYRQAHADGFDGTDTASTAERYTDLDVVVVPGPSGNVKITYPSDVEPAEERRT